MVWLILPVILASGNKFCQVSGVQETVLVDDLGCGLRILIISFHGVVTAVAHFTLHAYRALFAGFRVDDFHFGMSGRTFEGCDGFVQPDGS